MLYVQDCAVHLVPPPRRLREGCRLSGAPPSRPEPVPPPARRLSETSCTLRDTFFGHPESVYTATPETLAHRARVPDCIRPTPRPAKSAGAKTPARRPEPKQLPSAPPPARRLSETSCTLRDTFFGHPESVYTATPETLAHRAQIPDGLRPTPRPAKSAGAKTPARRPEPKQLPSAPPPARRLSETSCTLRDTFFGHPESVYTATPETLAHRVQVPDGPRPTPRPAKSAGEKTPARRLELKQLPSAPPPARRLSEISCTLRDTFFGHPESVYTATPETLAHRAQVPDGLRPTPRPAKSAGEKTPARKLGLKQLPSAPPSARRLSETSCTLRDTFFGHPESVYTATPETLAHRAQAPRPLRPASDVLAVRDRPCFVASSPSQPGI